MRYRGKTREDGDKGRRTKRRGSSTPYLLDFNMVTSFQAPLYMRETPGSSPG